MLLLHEDGLSTYKIARSVGKDHSCVSRFLRTARSQPSSTMPGRLGRSRLLSPRDERVLRRVVLSGMHDTASEIARNAASLGLPPVSAVTIRRALRRQGLVA